MARSSHEGLLRSKEGSGASSREVNDLSSALTVSMCDMLYLLGATNPINQPIYMVPPPEELSRLATEKLATLSWVSLVIEQD